MTDEKTVIQQDLAGLLRQLLNTDYIPVEVRSAWWVLTSDDMVLSFHDKGDIDWIMNQFDLLELRTRRKFPGHKFNTDQSILMNQIRMVFFARLNRSKNGGERIAQVSQKISNEEVRSPQLDGRGFFSSIKDLVSGG